MTELSPSVFERLLYLGLEVIRLAARSHVAIQGLHHQVSETHLIDLGDHGQLGVVDRAYSYSECPLDIVPLDSGI